MAKKNEQHIKFEADIGGFKSNIKEAEKSIASLNSTLKLNKAQLAGNSESTELLSKRLETLKGKYNQQQIAIDNTRASYEKAVEVFGENSEEAYKLKKQLTDLQTAQQRTKNEIDKTNSEIEKQSNKFEKAGQKATEWGNNISKAGEKLNELGNKVSVLSAGAAGIATAGILYNAEIEKYTKSFETFLGDAKEAEKVVNQIKKDASKTPFDVTSLVRANQMLISTGENAQDTRETILALGDAVIATGGGNDELTRMASNLQQIRNAGKATSMDIRQFAYAGIDIYGLLAKYTGKNTEEVKDMTVSYDVLSKALKNANKEGGKYYNAMNKASDTLTGQVNQLKAEVKDMTGDLTKSLMPTAKDVVSQVRTLTKSFDGLSDSQKKTIVNIGLGVAAAGPALKILGTTTSAIGGGVKAVGTLSEAIGVLKTGTESANASANLLAKGIGALTSPTTLAIVGITTAVAALTIAIKNADKDTKDAFSNMGQSASDFVNGIDSATSHLDSFNSTLFASAEEQQKLQEDMENVQKGITEICKTASDERRGYTQKEISQLDEYFTKLRELKNRELEIQKSISRAITQQAEQNAESFQGSLDEYKVQSQEWIRTAEEQASREIAIINERTTQEIALLQQRYGDKATLDNEEYAREYNLIQENKNKAIKEANDEVAKVNLAYANGYLKRSKQNDGFFQTFQNYNSKIEEENKRHNNVIDNIENNALLTQHNKNQSKYNEDYMHQENRKKIWNQMYKDMSEEQEKELGVLLAEVAQTELYGGKIDDETKRIVDSILNSYDSMPKRTKEAMKNAMEPMLTEMQKKAPSLFAKASNIAEGILNRLKKSFDIHSPSKKTKKIFKQMMQGGELGIEDEEDKLYKQVDTLSDKMNKKLANIGFDKNKIPSLSASGGMNIMQSNSIVDGTKTIFTTPQIVFNVQELDEAKLQQCVDYINRKFGSEY